MDAFGAAHRPMPPPKARCVRPGRLRRAADGGGTGGLRQVLDNPARPLAAVIGGSKVSTKLGLLDNLLAKVDSLVVGRALPIPSWPPRVAAWARPVQAGSDRKPKRSWKRPGLRARICLCPWTWSRPGTGPGQRPQCAVGDVPADEMILDIGPKTVALYEALLARAATVVWNGPVGAFETEPFGAGTKALAEALAASRLLSWWAAATPWPRWKAMAGRQNGLYFPRAAARPGTAGRQGPALGGGSGRQGLGRLNVQNEPLWRTLLCPPGSSYFNVKML